MTDQELEILLAELDGGRVTLPRDALIRIIGVLRAKLKGGGYGEAAASRSDIGDGSGRDRSEPVEPERSD
jgi:hypothetical protein